MKPAIVQSIHDVAIREINAMEQRIAKAEDDADAILWTQAEEVAAELDAGLSLRKLATQWINARTGKPYDKHHVSFVRQVFQERGELTPRPRFRAVYNDMANASGRSVHHSSDSVEHYTPKAVLDPVIAVMGGIDLDPCSNADGAPNVPARRYFTAQDDGLTQPWRGRVFVNPPYGDVIAGWAKKIRDEWMRGDVSELIALLPARPDTAWWETLTAETDDVVVCFWRGRLTFLGNGHPAPFPSVVVYFGPQQDLFARVFAPLGGLWVRPPLGFFVNHDDDRPF